MPNVISPYYKVLFNGIDITEDISDDVLEIVYDEGDDGEADDLRILLDDMSGKWKDKWIVAVGQTIEVEMGYPNGRRLNCGKFQIDEVEYKGQPDSVELKCLSIGEDNKWREPDSRIFVDQTVEQIVQHFATKNGVSVVRVNGYAPLRDLIDQPLTSIEIGAAEVSYERRVFSMRVQRLIQDREPDISFLTRFLEKWGIGFRLSPERMYIYLKINYTPLAPITIPKIYYGDQTLPSDFYSGDRILYEGQLIDLEKNIQLFSYDIKNCSKNAVSGVELRYFDPFGNEIIKKSVRSSELPRTLDDLKNLIENPLDEIRRRMIIYADVDNEQQAEIAATAALYDTISKQLEGELELDGAPEVIRGVAVPVLGLKKLSGNYYVTKSYHRLNRRDGYTTSASVKWISPISSS